MQETNSLSVLLIDFSYTLCFPKTKENVKSLNGLYTEIKEDDEAANPLDIFILNQELLDFLRSIKQTHKIYIFTSGFIHTDPVIMQSLKLIFDGYITSSDLRMPKSFPNAYKIIANKIGVETKNLLFIDDQQKNILAAQTAGATGLKFTNNTETISEIKKLIE